MGPLNSRGMGGRSSRCRCDMQPGANETIAWKREFETTAHRVPTGARKASCVSKGRPRCKRGPYQTDRATQTEEMRGSAFGVRIGPTHPNRCRAQCVLRLRIQTMLPARDVDAHGVCRASFPAPPTLAGICTNSPWRKGHHTTVKPTVEHHATLRVDWRSTG